MPVTNPTLERERAAQAAALRDLETAVAEQRRLVREALS